jgi:hypothetical protein
MNVLLSSEDQVQGQNQIGIQNFITLISTNWNVKLHSYLWKNAFWYLLMQNCQYYLIFRKSYGIPSLTTHNWSYCKTLHSSMCQFIFKSVFRIWSLTDLHFVVLITMLIFSYYFTPIRKTEFLTYGVSEWLLFDAKLAIFQRYNGMNKLIFNEMMRFTLY